MRSLVFKKLIIVDYKLYHSLNRNSRTVVSPRTYTTAYYFTQHNTSEITLIPNKQLRHPFKISRDTHVTIISRSNIQLRRHSADFLLRGPAHRLRRRRVVVASSAR